MSSEEFRPIPGWENYLVSPSGVIKRARDGLLREPYWSSNVPSYLYLVLRNGGKRRSIAVHRCVALAYLPKPDRPEQREVAHLDGDSKNNHFSNLCWASRSENERHKVGHGRSNRGGRQHMARLTEQTASEARRLLRGGLTQQAVGETFGVARTTIAALAQGRTWAWVP